MRRYIICSNGGLLHYIIESVPSGVEVEIIENVDDIIKGTLDISQDDTYILGVSWHETDKWLKAFKENGINEVYVVSVFIKQYNLPIWDENGHFSEHVAVYNLNLPYLYYLETHAADTCNLKCRGCMHFSNLCKESKFPDIVELERDIKRIAELYDNIVIFRLLGGEPLLNKNLYQCIKVIRKYFPKCELRITTNGLLIPKQDNILFQTMREQHVIFDITPYPPTVESADEIEAKLDAETIPHGQIVGNLSKFRKSLTLRNTNNPEKAKEICGSKHCHFLRNGKIAKCPLIIMLEDFNAYYGMNIKADNDIFDIYEEKSGEELKKKLDSNSALCCQCPDYEVFIDWERTYNNAEMEDWIAE